MGKILLGIHIIACAGLISFVLLQVGKGSALTGLFGGGGGSSDSLFGGVGGSPFLRKITTGFAILFFTTSLVLAVRAARFTQRSVVEKAVPQELPDEIEPTPEMQAIPDASKLPVDI
ncbi:preprotein translocase subunit SecG, partial [bacterium]|nr:preprotein translocase subunit SecG [bacterium]